MMLSHKWLRVLASFFDIGYLESVLLPKICFYTKVRFGFWILWGALTDSPPRLLWCDKEARENLLAFANRIFRDAGQFGVARGRVQLALRVKADDSRLKPVFSTWHASTVPAASLLSPMLSKLPARTAAPMSPMICRTPLMLSQTFGNKFGNGTLNVKSCCACVATP